MTNKWDKIFRSFVTKMFIACLSTLILSSKVSQRKAFLVARTRILNVSNCQSVKQSINTRIFYGGDRPRRLTYMGDRTPLWKFPYEKACWTWLLSSPNCLKCMGRQWIDGRFAGCPKKIVPRWCGCCGGAIDSIILVFTQLRRSGFNLEFETLHESVWHMVADLWQRTDKINGCFKKSTSIVLQQCLIK